MFYRYVTLSSHYPGNAFCWKPHHAENAQTIAENCDLEDFAVTEDADAILYHSIAAPPAALAQRFDPQQFEQNFDFDATENEVRSVVTSYLKKWFNIFH